ncbi:hypothetical protein [uncultured Paludibaculum sp.]|uniref:hypothetical protein n=1 Tax=uncultured Paludibaculum sp. TaxID=1765020 RepID=UPI002AAB3F89|nr:hypothetical protein [uncultured Paludibaculum sp.]
MKLTSLMLCALCSAALAPAQDRPDPTVYRVEFQLRDGGDKAAPIVRRYSMLMDPSGKGSFRLGQRVPYSTGAVQAVSSGGQPTPLVSTQFQYAEVGVNIDCRLRETGTKVALNSDLEISTVTAPDKGSTSNPLMPTIGSMRLSVAAVLTPGKPTSVASIDDPVTHRKFEVEATVTKVN